MKIIRPLQISFNNNILEHNRRFYFTASLTLGINLVSGEELLDMYYLKDVFESMGENPFPDMGMPKPNGEFLVSGSFHAPKGESVTGGEVQIKFGDIEKKLIVFGQRKWVGAIPSRPELIRSMPMDNTKTFGGKDFKKNPDGIGFNDGLLPCIEYPNQLIASKGDKPDPALLSVIPPMFPQRTQFQGTYGADYKEKYFPGYPEDFNWKFFLCAPEDQWIKDFYGGHEIFSIYNMHPEIPVIKGCLPNLYARCFINQEDKNGKEIFGELPLNLDTTWFFPEKLLGLLIFRGVVEVDDYEAVSIKHILCAYEDRSKPSKPLEYYKKAFKKRKDIDDGILNYLNTPDLIPDEHKSAMELLMDDALGKDKKSEFTNNINAKADSMNALADEKIEETLSQVEKNMDSIDIPEETLQYMPDGKDKIFDVRQFMDKTPKNHKPDPDVVEFKNKLESIMPGITAGDPKKMQLKDFSFNKIDEIFDAVTKFSTKKETQAKASAQDEINKAKAQIKEEIKTIEKQMDQDKKSTDPNDAANRKILEGSKQQIQKSLGMLDEINLEKPEATAPLPRINIKSIKAETDVINPQMMEMMQNIQIMKKAGKDNNDYIKNLEKELQEMMESSTKEMEKGIKKAEQGFKQAYLMGAHFMNKGESPHKDSLEDIKKRFLSAVSTGEDVSGQDWACIDLSGENLDGIDLSGAFLEQVDFKGASLKDVNFKEAILVRANLEGADFSGANFEKANIGAVHALKTNFSRADFKSAKLSKGNFSSADFSKANLEDIESLEMIIDNAIFDQANMPGLTLMEISISKAKFLRSKLNTNIFLNCKIDNCDFSGSKMEKCSFVNTKLNKVCFEQCDLSNACFLSIDKDNFSLENLSFKGACLNQANFQNMELKNSDFTLASLENAYFGESNLSGADFSDSRAKNAQFRKADLTGAKLNNINLDQGSLAGANLANASFAGANLHGVDFLRSNISKTDFMNTNLDSTLIEHWRPE